jgi:hypothetical protein
VFKCVGGIYIGDYGGDYGVPARHYAAGKYRDCEGQCQVVGAPVNMVVSHNQIGDGGE